MDKGHTRTMKGRLRIAAVVMVCLIAVMALPAFASAAWMGNYPSNNATIHVSPSIVGVDYFGTKKLNARLAEVTIDGVAKATFVDQGSTAGRWSVTEVLSGGVYRSQWTWTATGDPAGTKATVFAYASGLATGTHTVNVDVVDAAGTAASTSWSFFIEEQPVVVPPVTPAGYDNTICTSSCHKVGGTAFGVTGNYAKDYVNDNAMGAKCADCHSGGFTPTHGIPSVSTIQAIHTLLEPKIDGDKSDACTVCHGTNVGNVLPLGNPVTGVLEHNGCSCHMYYEASGAQGASATSTKQCVDCHAGPYAPHGFTNGFAHGSGFLSVSGHNTTNLGTRGAVTDFSSLGIKDTVGATPTAQFPLSVNNTFKAGYSWTSEITCEDCHTGLTALEVAGPHGGATVANWGIDPAYPGSFESASLWGGSYVVTSGQTPDGSTVTFGPFAEGIAQWANTSTVDPEGLAGYQVMTPDMSTDASKKIVVGPASVTAGDVICVKCHDLYDSTKTTGYKGWGNYAHEHHSADTGSFKMIFGKYAVKSSDGTTYTVAAESMAAAKAEVIADHGGSVVASSQVIAASLGREVAGACRNCHIAIPHGWKRPKLIVYSNLSPNDPARAAKNMPATGDSAPYNIGPAVYEGEGLWGTNVGSGQMNAMASGPVHFLEATHVTYDGGITSLVATAGSVANGGELQIEAFDFPSLFEAAPGSGDEYINWSSAQCNACGHHSSTSFTGGNQPAMAFSTRELNWSSTKPATGAWK